MLNNPSEKRGVEKERKRKTVSEKSRGEEEEEESRRDTKTEEEEEERRKRDTGLGDEEEEEENRDLKVAYQNVGGGDIEATNILLARGRQEKWDLVLVSSWESVRTATLGDSAT